MIRVTLSKISCPYVLAYPCHSFSLLSTHTLNSNEPCYKLVSNNKISQYFKSHFLPLNVKTYCTTSKSELEDSKSKIENLNKISGQNVTQEQGSKTQGGWQGRFTGKNAWKLGLLSLSVIGCICFGQLVYFYGPPKVDEDGNTVDDDYTQYPKVWAYFRRTTDEIATFYQTIRDPVSEKLLPDPVQPPFYQPPYTLVVEMNGVLVHPDWTFKTGWRFKKRPALEVFLQQVSPFFEVVAFTQESAMTGQPILQQLDPKGQYIHYRLFRESTRYQQGKHRKDLSCLNRDLKRVILIDWDPDAYKLQPHNAFRMKRWRGDDDDLDLLDLAAFLRMLATSGVDDLRTVLDHYNSFEEPLEEFKKRQGELVDHHQKVTKDKKSATKVSTASSLTKWNTSSWIKR